MRTVAGQVHDSVGKASRAFELAAAEMLAGADSEEDSAHFALFDYVRGISTDSVEYREKPSQALVRVPLSFPDAELEKAKLLDTDGGVHAAAFRRLAERGTRLVVTVDCGIRAAAEVAEAARAGMDVIVTDHHVLPDELPRAAAIVNPRRPDCGYDFRDFAAVGLAHKLRTMRIAQAETGEVFGVLATNPRIAAPVQLDVRLIEADQVCSPALS